ncbi:DnaJ domain-containing protein [Clostridium botulinum]|uniref:DnaJ domain-containing protein n=1 Tax=Clostridium botulinum TaxID=1491 RepID=UPI0005970A21|nr:DnaJ domain-containing protein [Clostridium botulinum]KIL09573.1 molecular chaperone DnaJ [Clostridium botulinum]MBY6809130.1 DnaJ domain-containing protein [Clostridium botulinum]MBY6822165.1 DnaJ domain-containing protein [Clostridium botulinum]MBY6833045.1 DnaJ domain-containing protein [Clostridium botulinum]MBY6929935.1 DnaJ domain-containing protein [Clostridium botulinum]
MTDYHKILGVEKNASKEEIKEAYEKQVEKIKKEVVNEKRLNQFLKVFDEAYEVLNSIEENSIRDKDETLIIKPKEIEQEQVVNNGKNLVSRNRSKSRSKNTSSKKRDTSKRSFSENKDKKNKLNDNREEKSRKQKVAEKSPKSNSKQIFDLLMLPLKILALPLIAVLSIIVLVCQIINVISWIASKVLIVGSISIGAIHLYQVKMGQVMNYNILVLAASVLLASFFLPYILKFLLTVFQKLNNMLKDFVF